MNIPQIKVAARDGSLQDFDFNRIATAVAKAVAASGMDASGSDGHGASESGAGVDSSTSTSRAGSGAAERTKITPQQLAAEVTGQAVASGRQVIGVEEIQDIVENRLVHHRLYEVAKAYMLYRARHEQLRSLKPVMLDIQQTMDGYLGRSDWRVNENANVNYSLGGLILHNSGALTANYWLKHVYSKAVAAAHENASMHIHDLSMFSGYCAGWSLRQLINEGLGGVPDKISSAPARHLTTLVQQMVNFLGIMQNEWAGAQAFSSFDTYLAPFVKKDDLSYEQVKQSLQSFIFGVNTPSRWGSQAPFTNITLDWCVPADLAGEAAVVGGQKQDFTYAECQPEMDMINRAFLELMIQGDAAGRGFQYPIPTYNITRSFNWDSPNAELLFTMTAKFGTPYFQNFLNSDLNPADVRSMCCRLQLDKRELRKRGGGLFGSDEFTGSIGVVTINLPQIGHLARNTADFFTRLDALMDLACESLETKRRVVEKLMEQGLFPYTRRYLKHLNNHFSTIGIVGMNEALQNLNGSSLLDDDGRSLAGQILDHMRMRLTEFQQTTGQLYNLEASPAEGTSYRLALHDSHNYPGIITAGSKDDPYYTNSSHLPVDATQDVFHALQLQDGLQTRYTGGTVFHAFLGEAVSDWRACRELVHSIAGGFHLPYFTISPTYSVCENHGYLDGEIHNCPHCGNTTEVYSRIVGYYRSLRNWNLGKKQEFTERESYSGQQAITAGLTVPTAAHADGNLAGQAAAADPAAVVTATSTSGQHGVRLQLFTTPTCPHCPDVRQKLQQQRLPVETIDASGGSGAGQASQAGIITVPTLVCQEAATGAELWRSSDAAEMVRLAATASLKAAEQSGRN